MIDKTIRSFEDCVLELEYQRVKRLIGRSAKPKPRTTSPPSPAPASENTVIVERACDGKTRYRTASGRLLPDDRSAWPASIRKMVEVGEKVDCERAHAGGYLLGPLCHEPVCLRS